MRKLEPLGSGVEIYVSKNHTFGTDAVLLSHFASPKRSETACDLGTGCGIIPLLWFKNGGPKWAVGVDIQPEAIDLAEQSIEHNKLNEKFSVVCSDMQDLKGKVPFGSFKVVTCNPPYKADGAGIKSQGAADIIARHESTCSLDDIIAVAAHLLQPAGRLCMCNRPERLPDMICSMRENGIEPKKLRLVCQRAGEEPWLVLLEGRRCGNSSMRIAPTLYVEENGALSQEMLTIYGDYKGDRL